jgi:mannose-6-phosphate isomerase-like protein (cupin superfamily)
MRMMTMNNIIGVDTMPKYQKGWGYELWVHNDADYCGKELVLYKDKKCSVHYHKVKKETFYVVSGSMIVDLYSHPFRVDYEDLDEAVDTLVRNGGLAIKSHYMEKGDSLLIDPQTPHRFRGLAEETRFMEFSTQHFEEDSYRIWPGDSQNG